MAEATTRRGPLRAARSRAVERGTAGPICISPSRARFFCSGSSSTCRTRVGTTARRLLLLHSSDRRVERDGRGDALTHARRQTRHTWVILAAALQPGRGALRSSPSSSLSSVGVLVSRRLFGRRSVRSKRAACLHRDGGRARGARCGWFSPPQSSRAVRARRGGLLLLLFSRPVRRSARAPLLRSARGPAGVARTTSGRTDVR